MAAGGLILKKRRIINGLLWIPLLFLTVVSCFAQQTDTDESRLTIYKVNNTETSLVTESVKRDSTDLRETVEQIITVFNPGESTAGDSGVLPENGKIIAWNLTEEGVLKLHFDSGYREIAGTREVLVRAGIVKTFVQLPEIGAVHFLVGEEELASQKGEEFGNMTGDSFVELFSSDRESYRYDTFTLYFTDKNGRKLLPESRRVYYRSSIPKARVALEQLAKGPIDKGHYPTIPDSTELRSVVLSDRVCYADFDRVFVEQRLDLEPMVAVYSVVNTLIANTDAEKAEITIAGQAEATLGEDLDLYNYYQWNEDMIGEE